ncbi:MAG: 50S ribosomal protein L20 [Candidatus Adiutrix intracellularis]|jgi:large subunit ribosomal protein L20|nr:MAG: 50S ribosomal protein L20 [Candidatus Adiutrix intracellularis]MDR2827109.1 50S ribosomal protein L20 [Candidatus Adiutrix intracellularis]
MRIKGGVKTKKRHSKYMKLAKGYQGGRGVLYRSAREGVERGLCFAYRDRKVRKREMRALWIVRISAAAKELGTSYSCLINTLYKAGILINRKMLAELAVSDFAGFAQLIKTAHGSMTPPAAA